MRPACFMGVKPNHLARQPKSRPLPQGWGRAGLQALGQVWVLPRRRVMNGQPSCSPTSRISAKRGFEPQEPVGYPPRPLGSFCLAGAVRAQTAALPPLQQGVNNQPGARRRTYRATGAAQPTEFRRGGRLVGGRVRGCCAIYGRYASIGNPRLCAFPVPWNFTSGKFNRSLV